MHPSFLPRLSCPDCGGLLALEGACEARGEIESGVLSCPACGERHSVVNFVPRFVSAGTYADSFGYQWNRFRKTQLDSHSGVAISRDRFFRETGWRPEELAGRRVLDVGCGAGRFAEVALAAGADVTAIDYSNAVDASWENLGPHERLHVIQADLYRLPFPAGGFDFVYCLGVLQHTPDVEAAFAAAARQVRPGGKIAVDVYPRTLLTYFWPKYWLRPIARLLPLENLFRLVEAGVPRFIPISRFLGGVPGIGRKLRYVVPIMDYGGLLPLSRTQLEEWAILDTFDMYAPAHDEPQTEAALRSWFAKAGLEKVEVFTSGFLVGRAVKGTG